MHCAMLIDMQSASSPPDLIGTAEACRILNIHASTLSRKVAAGLITPAHKLPADNGAFLFNREDVEALLRDETSA